MNTTKQRRRFLTSIAIWVGLMTILTPWWGVFYKEPKNKNPDAESAKEWRYGGTFGLTLPFSPIFLPPSAYGLSIDAVARYPFMSRNHPEVVELDWRGIAVELWLGAVLLGLFHGQSERSIMKERLKPDVLLCAAHSVSLTLIAIAPCWVVLNLIIFGFSAAEADFGICNVETKVGAFTLTSIEVMYLTLGLGLAVGTILGYLKFRNVKEAVIDAGGSDLP